MRSHRDSPMHCHCAPSSAHAAVQAATADAERRASRPDVQEHPASIARRKRPPARTGKRGQGAQQSCARSAARSVLDGARGSAPFPPLPPAEPGPRSPAPVPRTRPGRRSGAQEAPGRPPGPRRASGSPRTAREAARDAQEGAGGAWEAPGGSRAPRRGIGSPGRPRGAARDAQRGAPSPLTRDNPLTGVCTGPQKARVSCADDI